MIPAAFDYVRADSVDGGVGGAHRARRGRQAPRRRHVAPAADEAAARGADACSSTSVASTTCATCATTATRLAIGALSRHRDLETDALLAAECGVVQAVAAEVGDNQVRHRGTIGGSVAHGDPASDLPGRAARARRRLRAAAARAGRARCRPRSSSPASSRPRSRPTSCSPRSGCPRPAPNGFSYQKFNRRAQDWAIVGAVAVRADGATRVGLVNMGATPLRGACGGGRARRRRVAGGGGRGRGRRHRGVVGRQRHRRVPRAPGTRARPAGRWRRSADRRRPTSRSVCSRPAGPRASTGVKQLAPLGDRPLVRWAVDAAVASGCARWSPSSGPRSGPIQAVLPQGVDVVRGAAREGRDLAQPARARAGARGLGAGRRGVRRARRPAAVSARRPTAGWPRAYDAGATLAVATYAGQRQNPVLIARPLWPRVARAAGRRRARGR